MNKPTEALISTTKYCAIDLAHKNGRSLKDCLGMEIDVAVTFGKEKFNIKTTTTSKDITDYLISYCTMLAIDCKLSQAVINGDPDCSGYLEETVCFDGKDINVSTPITSEMIKAYNN